MGAIGEGLQSLAGAIQIGGLNDLLNSGAEMAKNAGDRLSSKEQREAGEKKYHNIADNLKRMWHDKVMQATTLPHINGMGALLIGEPVGEWHLTVGNPLNPIMVCGNLICEKMQVEFNDELGPDDFPTEMSITYTLKHGMDRDRDGIQSMFNRGMGKFYCLPDYIKLSSDLETTVDNYTGNNNPKNGKPGQFEHDLDYLSFSVMSKLAKKDGVNTYGFNKGSSGGGKALGNTGNPDVQLVTNYTPVDTMRAQSISNLRDDNFSFVNASNVPIVRSLAITRKMTGD